MTCIIVTTIIWCINVKIPHSNDRGSVLLEGILVLPLYLILLFGLFALAGHVSGRSRLAVVENSAIFAPGSLALFAAAAGCGAGGLYADSADRQYLADTDFLLVRNYALTSPAALPAYLRYDLIGAFFYGSAADGFAGENLQTSAAGKNANQLILRNDSGRNRNGSAVGLIQDRALCNLCGINPDTGNYAWRYERNSVLNGYSD